MNSTRVIRVKLNGRPVSEALTNDYLRRSTLSPAVVVTARPYVLLSVTRKRWLKGLRKMRIQRARLLAGPEANKLTDCIMALETLRFVAGQAAGCPKADLIFTSLKELIRQEHSYRVMYVAQAISTPILRSLIYQMPSDGQVIIYEE